MNAGFFMTENPEGRCLLMFESENFLKVNWFKLVYLGSPRNVMNVWERRVCFRQYRKVSGSPGQR